MYRQTGYGLGMSYGDVMSLDWPDVLEYARLLEEQLELDAQALKGD